MKKRIRNSAIVTLLLLSMFIQVLSNPVFIKSNDVIQETEELPVAAINTAVSDNNMLLSGVTASVTKNTLQLTKAANEEAKAAYGPITEADIYSFLQGPLAWGSRMSWSGIWAETVVDENSFAGFGCGLVVLANVYSTISQYECSPLDMLSFARSVSNYYPTYEAGAIGWDDMNLTLQQTGMVTQLRKKPVAYEEFQEDIASAKASIVLISSAQDDSFWQDVPGHYVTLYLYDEDTDTVFLTDSGDPLKNRTRIPLRYVYDALKRVSEYQYLKINAYSESGNLWKKNGITDIWVRPS